jgi:uncharacterized protein YigE (DUF2233 family)
MRELPRSTAFSFLRTANPAWVVILVFGLGFLIACRLAHADNENDFVAYIVNTQKSDLRMFWKDRNGQLIGNFRNLKTRLAGDKKSLIFATNGGIFTTEKKPLGLFVDNFKTVVSLNKKNGYGNFYMKPNGVFFITCDDHADICITEKFPATRDVKYAIQSGPMLVINGKRHPRFSKESSSKFVRNGVGILPNGRVLFVMSKEKINLYDFAGFFLAQGCHNALYLDGYVSRTYLPEKKWIQDGDFGVIIGVTD